MFTAVWAAKVSAAASRQATIGARPSGITNNSNSSAFSTRQWRNVWRKTTGNRRRRTGSCGCGVTEVQNSDVYFSNPLLLRLRPAPRD